MAKNRKWKNVSNMESQFATYMLSKEVKLEYIRLSYARMGRLGLG